MSACLSLCGILRRIAWQKKHIFDILTKNRGFQASPARLRRDGSEKAYYN